MGARGNDGGPGPQGPRGADGIDCWDLNANGRCDLAIEDVNRDGACSILDCQGTAGPHGDSADADPQGLKGDQGDAGSLGLQGPKGDSGVSLHDALPILMGARGNDGGPGPQGPRGADGIDCWDLNANGRCDPDTEDVNRDGACSV